MKKLLLSLLLAVTTTGSAGSAFADSNGGFDSVADTNYLKAGGTTVLTLQGSSQYANFLGSIGVAGNQSVQGASSVAGDLSVAGNVHFKGPLEVGTEGNGSFLQVGASEFSPALLIGGATTNNTDPIYFQRYNENSDTSSLRLVIGDNYGQQYVPGAAGTAGDAFIIGSLNSSDSSYGFVPNFTFTSDGKLGIGTKTPGSLLSVGSNSEFQVNGAGDVVVTGGSDGRFGFYHQNQSGYQEVIAVEANRDVDFMGGRVGIGTSAPAGNLDIENGQNTATLCLNGHCTAALPHILGQGTVNSDDGGSGSVHCRPVSFTPWGGGGVALGNVYYTPGAGHAWTAWSVFFTELNFAAGTANVCMDSGGNWHGHVGAENISYVIYGY